jgi:hypothetical protein
MSTTSEVNEQAEFSDTQLRAALKRVGEDARSAAFKAGRPVTAFKGQQLIQVFPDGHEVTIDPSTATANDATSAG